MEEDGIVLDGNHPLAGRNLKFEVELVKAGGVIQIKRILPLHTALNPYILQGMSA
jgi:FKBP-type peptidyl-prolyl cis-trans isomerase 2